MYARDDVTREKGRESKKEEKKEKEREREKRKDREGKREIPPDAVDAHCQRRAHARNDVAVLPEVIHDLKGAWKWRRLHELDI